jgi:transcriptional regulator with XRE-family HTH domain
MTQKPSRHKRKTLGIRIKPQEGLWISYQLRLKGITGRSFAAKHGVRESTVSQVINGHRSSRRLEEALCQALGYPSFGAMIAASRGHDGGAV